MQPHQIRSVEQLQKCIAGGKRAKFVFFWGHRTRPGAGVTKACFSQWYPAPFVVDDVRYPTAEHYMMAAKARLFADRKTLAKILQAPSPGAAKTLGRQVAGFDEAQWQEERFAIVVTASCAKFGQNPALLDFLLATRKRVLVEASPRDRIWGIGLAEDDSRASNPLEWRGLNLLGFALMAARTELAARQG